MYVYDRSRVTIDWNCPRKRYWEYHYGGKGIVGNNIHLELFTGTTIHDGLATIAMAHRGYDGYVDIDSIAKNANRQMAEGLLKETTGEVGEVDFASEQGALVEGLLRGFYRYTWPSLIARYPKILHIEEEMKFEHGGMTFMSRPDLVLGNDEEIVYVEYKSTSSKKEGWINSWNTAIQLHSTVRAIEETTGEKVSSVIVQGLYKGFESYGKQASPFCYGYHRFGNPPFSKTETLYEWKAGFKRIPTWEMEGGVKKWVEEMPENVLAEQFPQTPPIFVNEDMIDAFFTQRNYREHEIQLALQMAEGDHVQAVLDCSFPQKFDQCNPSFGKPCEYRRLCFGNVSDPLMEGYSYREPHHPLELEIWNEAASS